MSQESGKGRGAQARLTARRKGAILVPTARCTQKSRCSRGETGTRRSLPGKACAGPETARRRLPRERRKGMRRSTCAAEESETAANAVNYSSPGQNVLDCFGDRLRMRHKAHTPRGHTIGRWLKQAPSNKGLVAGLSSLPLLGRLQRAPNGIGRPHPTSGMSRKCSFSVLGTDWESSTYERAS